MPDNAATLAPEEQQYFDTRGGEAPASEPKAEVVNKQAPEKKSVKPSKVSTVPDTGVESVEEPVVSEPVKKTAEQEQIDNLNAALREERSKNKDFESKTTQRLQQLTEALTQRPAVPQAEAAKPQEIPDPDKDPLGTLKFLMNQQREVKLAQGTSIQEAQRHQQSQRVMGEASRLEMEYLREQPDYDAATNTSPTYNEASSFLINMRRAELTAIGAYNPLQISQMVQQEALGLAAQALQSGRNPAQVVMDVAKARGFSPKAKQAAPVAQPVATETEQEKLVRVAKGQEAGFSLSQASGSKAPNNKGFDAKTIANMSDDDFTSLLDKAKKSDLRAFMGD